MVCIIDSMHSSGALKIPFFKASLLRKLRAVDNKKSNNSNGPNGPNGPKGRIHSIVIYHCKVGVLLCILDTLAISMHFSGALKIPFFKASLLRKLRAVDNRKSNFEWSEWSKRTYTFYSDLPL